MAFTSFNFILFICLIISIYFVVPKRFQWLVLLGSSYLFYALAGIKLFVFLFLTTLSTYYTGHILEGIEEKRRLYLESNPSMARGEKKQFSAANKKKKRRVLAACLLLNFGLLAFLKYYNFTAENLNRFFPTGSQLPFLNLILPLGISFYIFQSAGYVIDIYRGKYAADRSLPKYALFVSFFPQIVQGPIGRYDRLAGQLYAPHSWDDTQAKYGIQLMLWGFLKKMVIADRTAVLVNQVFGQYSQYGGSIILIAVLFYSIQIYCDFSGGIDVARGVAQIMGITLDQNFRQPFFAVSVTDFWQRWHMTLSSWLKDYLFYPISLSKPMAAVSKRARKLLGNRFGKLIPACIATFAVYIVVGLWHGSSWKYIAFGLYNGCIITASLFLEPLFIKPRKWFGMTEESLFWRMFRVLRTLLLVCIGRYFSRGNSLMDALRMMKRTIFHIRPQELLNGTLLNLGLSKEDFIVLFIALVVLFGMDFIMEKGIDIRGALEKKRFGTQWAVMMVAVIMITFWGIFSGNFISAEFIYAQF